MRLLTLILVGIALWMLWAQGPAVASTPYNANKNYCSLNKTCLALKTYT